MTPEAIKFVAVIYKPLLTVAIIYKLSFTVAVIYKLSFTVAVIYKPSLTCCHLHADHSGTPQNETSNSSVLLGRCNKILKRGSKLLARYALRVLAFNQRSLNKNYRCI